MQNQSFAQAGEDLAMEFLLRYLNIPVTRYLDIGAYDPTFLSNTYFFQRRGANGVLIDPNPYCVERLRSGRKGDIVLEGCILGPDVAPGTLVPFYHMTEPGWNTCSKAEAEHMSAVSEGKVTVRRESEVTVLDVNNILKLCFPDAPPQIVSIDAEGKDLDVLKSINFALYRPPVVCVETLVCGTKRAVPEIPEFMHTVGYTPRGGSFVNTIFVDSALL